MSSPPRVPITHLSSEPFKEPLIPNGSTMLRHFRSGTQTDDATGDSRFYPNEITFNSPSSFNSAEFEVLAVNSHGVRVPLLALPEMVGELVPRQRRW
jgi:hypothetical protein